MFSLVQPWVAIRTSGVVTPATITLASIPIAGNLLIVQSESDGGTTIAISDTIGDGVPWTRARGPEVANVAYNCSIYYKIVGTPLGGGKTISSTPSASANTTCKAGEYTTGAAGTIALDVSSYVSTVTLGTSTNPYAPSLTTTGSIGLIVGFSADSSAAFSTAGAGYVSREATVAYYGQETVEDQYTSAAGTYAVTFVNANVAGWVAQAIAFKFTPALASKPSGWKKYLLAAGYFASAPAAILAPIFSAQSSPAGTVSSAYSYAFAASGSPTFALGTGALPTGLTLSSAGVLSGTPSAAAIYAFTVVATNSAGATSSTAQSVTIAASSGTGTFTLTWDPATYSAGGTGLGAITGYNMLYDTVSRVGGGVYAFSQFVAGAGSTTGTVNGLTNGATYYATVVATDGTNNSPANYEVSKLV